ncbi:adenylate/guanylate cyclase domain-containing protein [Bradyrhizobium sp. sBnM-33]|uniref:adenylate/guanylate cyclase domain-containing protein n=3 Tax=Bradyrhizobium sp. sBnM-33 TaxID=2831780 RepID=UPI00293E06EA|nr:adenylate/guanylate cyclase domain-containing protein [Bradyrhizobium sp. sBnM-33]WOH47638.1 adenylate/guanylate cyclase domain-containing protein [Bradyrhizobium sp. sBnM-33]
MTREQRRFAADVVGYSRLMGRDESGTVARLREHRKLHLEPVLAGHGGRLVKLTGDGALVEFASAVDALGAAIEFQQVMAEANRDQPQGDAIVFRIGLHLGDLIVDGDDLYGDGVNVAARLEAEATPGGIVISGDLHNAVAGRLKATFVALGELSLKNIERPVRAFGVQMDGIPATAAPPHATDVLLTLPDKPSIAVLPFENMSRDPEQEYFVDGLVEDIITGLSRFKSLFVIARNSTFVYKGKSPDIRQVGRELGVRYVLEGSVRKVGNRIRITGQLIDAANGTHLWADRFDGALEDVFELQDRVTENVVGIIAPRVEQAEIERARSKPARNLEAYDLVLRAVALTRIRRRPEVEQALGLLRQAVQIDPSYARGMANLSLCCWIFIAQGFGHRDNPLVADMNEVAQRAVALDPGDSEVVAVAALILGVSGDMETGLALVEKAIGLNRNNAEAFRVGGISTRIGARSIGRSSICSNASALIHWTRAGVGVWPTRLPILARAIMKKSWIGRRASFASAPMSRARFATARRASLFSAAQTRRGRSSPDCSSMRRATPYPRCAGTTSST